MGVTLRQCDRTEVEVLMVIAGSFEPHNGVVLSSKYIHPVVLSRGPAVLMCEFVFAGTEPSYG